MLFVAILRKTAKVKMLQLVSLNTLSKLKEIMPNKVNLNVNFF